jgi:hypothetical protein
VEGVVKRTTILADPELLLEARYLAKDEGKTFTALVHEALREYIERHRKPRELPSFVGIVSSGGGPWTAEELDEILKRDIHPIYGWSVTATKERDDAAAREAEREV